MIKQPTGHNVSTALALGLAALILVGAGCSVKVKSGGSSGASTTPVGGVYKSDNQGRDWSQVVVVTKTPDKLVTIAALGIKRLIVSPLDAKTIYALAGGSGLYVTKDGGEQWQLVYASNVQSVALHPTNKDVLYVASDNKVLRTENGGQDWKTVYIEPTPQVVIADLDLVVKNPKIVYALTNRGVVIRSDSEGSSWRQLYFFKQTMLRLYVNQGSPSVLYAPQPSGQLWRSNDAGMSWENTTDALNKQLKVGIQQFRQFSFLPGKLDAFLYSNQQGMYRSFDGGATWEIVKLVTAPSAVNISALVVNPSRADDIFYATPSAFYRSLNGGVTWATLPLPATLLPGALAMHPTDGKTLYLGFTR